MGFATASQQTKLTHCAPLCSGNACTPLFLAGHAGGARLSTRAAQAPRTADRPLWVLPASCLCRFERTTSFLMSVPAPRAESKAPPVPRSVPEGVDPCLLHSPMTLTMQLGTTVPHDACPCQDPSGCPPGSSPPRAAQPRKPPGTPPSPPPRSVPEALPCT